MLVTCVCDFCGVRLNPDRMERTTISPKVASLTKSRELQNARTSRHKATHIPCSSFRGRSSCNGAYDSQRLRRCRYNMTDPNSAGYCEDLPDTFKERATLQQTPQEWSSRGSASSDTVVAPRTTANKNYSADRMVGRTSRAKTSIVSDERRRTSVVVYGRNWCPYCQKAKALESVLRELYTSRGEIFEFEYVDLSTRRRRDAHDRTIRQVEYTTIPQVFINDKFVGGYSELVSYIAEKEKERSLV